MSQRSLIGKAPGYTYNMQFFGDISALRDNTTNPAGIVSATTIVEQLTNQSRYSTNLIDLNTTNPELIEDGFAVGKSSINCIGDWIGVNNGLGLNSSDDFWVALTFKMTGTATNRYLFSMGYSNTSAVNLDVSLGRDNGDLFIEFLSLSGVKKKYSTVGGAYKNVFFEAVMYWGGQNTPENSKLYIDGSEVSLTATVDDDISGIPPIDFNRTMLGRQASLVAWSFSGEFAQKLMIKKGEPNLTLIADNL